MKKKDVITKQSTQTSALGRWGLATSLEKRGVNQVSMGNIFNQLSPFNFFSKISLGSKGFR
jgi:hypothetical protein